jgi:hypothetical protein
MILAPRSWQTRAYCEPGLEIVTVVPSNLVRLTLNGSL